MLIYTNDNDVVFEFKKKKHNSHCTGYVIFFYLMQQQCRIYIFLKRKYCSMCFCCYLVVFFPLFSNYFIY